MDEFYAAYTSGEATNLPYNPKAEIYEEFELREDGDSAYITISKDANVFMLSEAMD